MRVNQVPEATELVPETPAERELLNQVVQALQPDPKRICAAIQQDERGTLVIWKF